MIKVKAKQTASTLVPDAKAKPLNRMMKAPGHQMKREIRNNTIVAIERPVKSNEIFGLASTAPQTMITVNMPSTAPMVLNDLGWRVWSRIGWRLLPLLLGDTNFG
jgi:hypothetical protein